MRILSNLSASGLHRRSEISCSWKRYSGGTGAPSNTSLPIIVMLDSQVHPGLLCIHRGGQALTAVAVQSVLEHFRDAIMRASWLQGLLEGVRWLVSDISSRVFFLD